MCNKVELSNYFMLNCPPRRVFIVEFDKSESGQPTGPRLASFDEMNVLYIAVILETIV